MAVAYILKSMYVSLIPLSFGSAVRCRPVSLLLQEMLLYFELQVSDLVGTGRTTLEALPCSIIINNNNNKKNFRAAVKSHTCLICLTPSQL